MSALDHAPISISVSRLQIGLSESCGYKFGPLSAGGRFPQISVVRRLCIRYGLALVLFALLTRDGSCWEYEPTTDPFRDRFVLHLSGLSHHVAGNKDRLTEQNLGVGFGYELGRFSSESILLNQAVISFNSEFYLDSFAQFGYAIGMTLQNKVFEFLDFGLGFGLIHEDHILEDHGYYIVPYVLPYLETTFDFPANLRMTVVPPVSGLTDGVATLQMIVRF